MLFLSVRLIGLEPTRRETPDPKSGASTNFATGAFVGAKLGIFLQFTQKRKAFFVILPEKEAYCACLSAYLST